jgi:predicted phosphodiesterase
MLLLVACLLVDMPRHAQGVAPAFLVQPYLQLGNHPQRANPDRLTLLWQAPVNTSSYLVELRLRPQLAWVRLDAPQHRRMRIEGLPAAIEYRQELTGLEPGKTFEYRVLVDGAARFSATARAPRAAGEPTRFAITGDAAEGTAGQLAIARQMYRAHPDLVFICGDIVYPRGLGSNYLQYFFPVYNAEHTPLLRSIPFVAAPGNHDLGISSEALDGLDRYPDAMAYFYDFAEPLNGSPAVAGSLRHAVVGGGGPHRAAFLQAAGNQFPRMVNFSFDYGAAHWTVLDSNYYEDWNNRSLRDWVHHDLHNSHARWKFVAFHHAPFHSSNAHQEDQWMRRLCDIFESEGVDVVWAGHVHNYQRSRPLRFKTSAPILATPPPGPPDLTVGAVPPREHVRLHGQVVPGQFDIDRNYDGKAHTHPRGIIYIVTGAGGADLYDAPIEHQPATWKPYTVRFIAHTHSFTQVDLDAHHLTATEIGEDGKAVDRWEITK